MIRVWAGARAAVQTDLAEFVSAASAWEIVIKSALGKLRTTRRPAQAVTDGGFRELPISFEHTEAVRNLPKHHADPFDRLIIAIARADGLTVVTSDATFNRYDVAILDARR